MATEMVEPRVDKRVSATYFFTDSVGTRFCGALSSYFCVWNGYKLRLYSFP